MGEAGIAVASIIRVSSSIQFCYIHNVPRWPRFGSGCPEPVQEVVGMSFHSVSLLSSALGRAWCSLPAPDVALARCLPQPLPSFCGAPVSCTRP
jgi:hypothetical protein